MGSTPIRLEGMTTERAGAVPYSQASQTLIGLESPSMPDAGDACQVKR
jgi:hypothetical protein